MSNKINAEDFKEKNIKFINLYNDNVSQRDIGTELKISLTTVKDKVGKGISLGVIKKRAPVNKSIKESKLAKEILKEQDEKRLIQQQVKEQSRTELIIDSIKEVLEILALNNQIIILTTSKGHTLVKFRGENATA